MMPVGLSVLCGQSDHHQLSSQNILIQAESTITIKKRSNQLINKSISSSSELLNVQIVPIITKEISIRDV